MESGSVRSSGGDPVVGRDPIVARVRAELPGVANLDARAAF